MTTRNSDTVDLTQPRTAEKVAPLLRWLATHFQPLGGKYPAIREPERRALYTLLTELAAGIEQDYEHAARCLFPDGPPKGRPKRHAGHEDAAIAALLKARENLGPDANKLDVEEEAAALLDISRDTLLRWLGRK